MTDLKGSKILGINGLGRIGKLTLWHHVWRKYFDEIVVNIGREAGAGMEDIVHYVERDSTYGALSGFLYGNGSEPVISRIDEENGTMLIDGVKTTFLRSVRNPYEIRWDKHCVKLVVDTTGAFLDPTLPFDHPEGSLRGYFESGVEKVVVSAPLKINDKQNQMPDDSVTTVMGVNADDYDPRYHKIISNASCTTNCLAHMIKPLLNYFGQKKFLSASMATVHSVTGSQQVLDRLPKSGATDLRKNRSSINNIILTTTGAAKALGLVIPEMKKIGFIAESVRIPVSTGSLIILVVNFQEEISGESIRRDLINNIYRKTAHEDTSGYLHYTDRQNVSRDIVGTPKAAVIIEGHETHTRTASVMIDLEKVPGLEQRFISSLKEPILKIPVTQAVVYGWYDNEMGSYVNMLGDRIVSVAESLL